MVSFSHDGTGTPEQTWRDAGWFDSARPLSLEEPGRLLVLAAHPDDESLGAGGMIATLADRGIPITVLIATNGEASHPHSTTRLPDDLAAIRRVEVATAVRALAPTATLRLLDLPDGDLANHRNSLEEALLEEALHEEVTRSEPADPPVPAPITWMVAPWRRDGHPDHEAAGEAAALVAARIGARLLEYPIWAWHWANPTDAVWPAAETGTALFGLALNTDARTRKTVATAAHHSQVEPLSDRVGDEAIVQPGFAAHFERGHELFVGDVADAEPDYGEPDNAEPAGQAAGESLTPGFFDDFYAGSHDPWGFETRWYEARKRAVTLAALPEAHYGSALELGCSIGVLSRDLADRTDTLLATDLAEQALAVARTRLAGLPGVTVERRVLPADWPAGTFDLVVVSEIGYYLAPDDLAILLERCRQSLNPGGTLLACHWRHPVGEYPQGGDDVHAALAALPGLERTVQHLERDFVLEVYELAPARSVAEREGLA